MNRAYVALGIGMICGVARGGTIPPLEFVTVGDPGNRETIPSEMPLWPEHEFGSVDHAFAITKSPITVEQWFEFVDAYEPFTDANGPAFISNWGEGAINGDPTYPESVAQLPAGVGWRYAARYCNWLQNGKVNEAWAFESGVYDTSTFGVDENGNYTDQREPSPGADYWLPSYDEWIKAVFYDPNRYGDGQEGYWLYPDGGNDPLIPGLPEDGGETEAGVEAEPGFPVLLPVGSYPNVQSPYGLLDVSGGEQEWTGTWAVNGGRFVGGSSRGLPPELISLYDQIDHYDYDAFVATNSFRVAMRVPAPGTVLFVCFPFPYRRRRRDECIANRRVAGLACQARRI